MVHSHQRVLTFEWLLGLVPGSCSIHEVSLRCKLLQSVWVCGELPVGSLPLNQSCHLLLYLLLPALNVF